MGKADAVAASAQERAARVAEVRELMKSQDLDAYVVRGTDRYLNEDVPIEESQRAWLSGFTGSIADLLITPTQAFIFIDGRYYLQADQETDPALYTVVRVTLGTPNEQAMYKQIGELDGVKRLGIEPDRFSVSEHQALTKALDGKGLELVALTGSLVEKVRGKVRSRPGKLRVVGDAIAGRTVDAKLEELRGFLQEKELDALVITALDDIAYLANLRGQEIAFQATFKGLAVVSRDRCAVALPGKNRDQGLELSPAIEFVEEASWVEALPAGARRVGFDGGTTTEAVRQAIAASGAEPVSLTSPLRHRKSLKNEAELQHMIHGFRRADKAIWATQSWLHRRIDKGEATTELDLAKEMERRFKRSGGRGLSFEVISAAGANGAVIHYSDPDGEKPIAPGTMVLLDTGTYYEGGYATDLTRTFIAGRKGVAATERQKFLFTLVLKGAIAGMTARFPEGTLGCQLDALCRQPLWNAGLQFLHGTGHGVGINVHEMPPRVAAVANVPMEVGQVFSIEPGVYIADEGGVRIENLVTVVKDPEAEGFLRVVPLTFSPLDKRLIETRMLNKTEKAYLKWSAEIWRQEIKEIPAPPPLA